jgi:hypothetical protein
MYSVASLIHASPNTARDPLPTPSTFAASNDAMSRKVRVSGGVGVPTRYTPADGGRADRTPVEHFAAR